jgi:hypothetical protein
MFDVPEHSAESREPGSRPRGPAWWFQAATAVLLIAGVVGRVGFLAWDDRWGPHHADEATLVPQGLAMWEGVTPRDVGWPASTMRIALSAGAGMQWLGERGYEAWQRRRNPPATLELVSNWIATRLADRQPLYKLGRLTALLIGVTQLLALVWALRRWLGPPGVLAGLGVISLGHLPVAFSQFVLADIAGLLFATLVVGLAARPTDRSIVMMGAMAGLAAASKFHFGLWLLAPIVASWSRSAGKGRRGWRSALASTGMCFWVIVTLVPWIWIDPTLALKEFTGEVFLRIGAGASGRDMLKHAGTIALSLGPLGFAGAVLALLALTKSSGRRLAPVILPTALGAAALTGSSVFFDRYVLVLLPGVAVLAGLGWEYCLGHRTRFVRAATGVGLVASLLFMTVNLGASQRDIGATHVDVLAARWVMQYVPPGAVVAVHDETVAPLPRTAEQLRACVARVTTSEAYRQKWSILGWGVDPDGPEPMRSMLLNDERYFAYLCRRELDVRSESEGYRVVLFHNGPRFWAVEEADAMTRFRSDTVAEPARIDVLILSQEADVGVEPIEIVRSPVGQRIIYVRPGLALVGSGGRPIP